MQSSMGSEGGDKEKEKGKELRERAIAAIRAHNNYRGKPLGNLPRWLEKLCTTEQFRAHADTLKNDNALATYAVEQVKHYSRKQGEPWDFTKESRKEKEERKEKERGKAKTKEREKSSKSKRGSSSKDRAEPESAGQGGEGEGASEAERALEEQRETEAGLHQSQAKIKVVGING